MMWPGCIHHEVCFGSFNGGFIYDPALPYRFDDFYYVDGQKECMVLISGVIYNCIEVIESLQLKNTRISTPKLVLKAFFQWGEDFVKKLNGDFAIFIYNKKSNLSFLYRDHMGVRPLAFSKLAKALFFSTDIMGLCKVTKTHARVDFEFILSLLTKYGLQSTPLTVDNTKLPNMRVRKVLPGHLIKILNNEISESRYWQLEDFKEDQNLNFHTALEEIKLLITDSVKIRCDDRFIASTHLSGGLDSGIVASLARKRFKEQKFFPGFSWTPSNSVNGAIEFDERTLVKKLGEHIGISPLFINVSSNDFIGFLSDWRCVTYLFSENKVREFCRANKVNLIFSGWGGDEFISINNIGIDSDLIFKFQWRRFLKKNPINKPKQLIGSILYNVILPALSLRYYSRKKPIESYSKYIRLKSRNKPRTINDLYTWRSRREMHLRYFYEYHIPERTEECSILGYRSGVEYRYPLIDKRIIEFILKVPSRLLYNQGYNRVLIREISEGLIPDEARWHVSKNDPVRVQALHELLDKVCEQLMDEVDDFKINPELDFINFDLLKKDIEAYRKGLISKRVSESLEILIFLKKAHEFTKAYCDETY